MGVKGEASNDDYYVVVLVVLPVVFIDHPMDVPSLDGITNSMHVSYIMVLMLQATNLEVLIIAVGLQNDSAIVHNVN